MHTCAPAGLYRLGPFRSIRAASSSAHTTRVLLFLDSRPSWRARAVHHLRKSAGGPDKQEQCDKPREQEQSILTPGCPGQQKHCSTKEMLVQARAALHHLNLHLHDVGP
eukprot:1161480-Pelagomonas_calceolata.AAC.13